MSLKEYAKKRDLNISKEPKAKLKKTKSRKRIGLEQKCKGKVKRRKPIRLPRFVVQEHHARNLHFDFRLEMNGVLKSWAVPKGIPVTKGIKHLAIQVEDHPLEYAKFQGKIPEGNYGTGTVKIWDKGWYEIKWADNKKIEVILHGKNLKGNYILVKTYFETNGNGWLIFKI